MTTTYTAPVEDGTITEIGSFVLQCVGSLELFAGFNFGEWPERGFEPDVHDLDHSILLCMQRLEMLRNMPDEEANERARKDWERQMEEFRAFKGNRTAEIDRLSAMRAKVQAWRPPSNEHHNLKRFMLDQLEGELTRYSTLGIAPRVAPEYLSGADWRTMQMRETESILFDRQIKLGEEIARTARRNEFLADLRGSL